MNSILDHSGLFAICGRLTVSLVSIRSTKWGNVKKLFPLTHAMNVEWQTVKPYEDILYHKWGGIAKITLNRPEKRNAFRPKTVFELYEAFADAREDPRIGVVLLTGAGPHTDGKYAFCSGRSKCARFGGLYWRGWGSPFKCS